MKGAGSLGLKSTVESCWLLLLAAAKFLFDRRATNSRMNGGMSVTAGVVGGVGVGGLLGKMGGLPIDDDAEDTGVVGWSAATGLRGEKLRGWRRGVRATAGISPRRLGRPEK